MFSKMMTWTATLMLLLYVGGCFGNELDEPEDNCYTRIGAECHNVRFPGFPETVDELRVICTQAKNISKCILRIKETCPYEEEASLKIVRNIVDFVDAACEEDSSFFQVISQNLLCVKKTSQLVDDVCHPLEMSQENRDLIESHEDVLLNQEDDVDYDNLNCLIGYTHIVCPSITAGIHCGSDVGQAVFEILENTDDRYPKCSEEFRIRLSSLYEVYEKVLKDEHNRRNSVGEK